MSWTKYWEKRLWILLIHHPLSCGHWVLGTIDLSSCRLLLFDSLAEECTWKRDLQVRLTFHLNIVYMTLILGCHETCCTPFEACLPEAWHSTQRCGRMDGIAYFSTLRVDVLVFRIIDTRLDNSCAN